MFLNLVAIQFSAMLTLSTTAQLAFSAAPVRSSPITMVAASPAPVKMVESWYDAGARLESQAEPVAAAEEPPAPATTGALKWSANFDDAALESFKARGLDKVVVEEKAREGKWNPRGLGAKDIPFVGELLEPQIVPDYLELAPDYLDGSLPGDVGLDPLCLAALADPTPELLGKMTTAKARQARMLAMSADEQAAAVAWMRNAELKHARLAMLAAAGWPLAELCAGPFLRVAVGTNGRAPALFNGGLFDFPFFQATLLVFGGLAFLEYQTNDAVKDGDYGFDPLGLATAELPFEVPEGVPPALTANLGDLAKLKEAEIKNGRAAMMAITGFSVQEAFWGTPVVDQTPFFFGR